MSLLDVFKKKQKSDAVKAQEMFTNALQEAQQKQRAVDEAQKNAFLGRLKQINEQNQNPKVATLEDLGRSVGTDFYDAFDEFGHFRGLGLGAAIGMITAKQKLSGLATEGIDDDIWHGIPEIQPTKLDIEQMQALIDQIHAEFNNAGDQLFKQAQEIVEKDNVNKTLDEKANRLKRFGFRQSKDVLLDSQINEPIKQKIREEKAYMDAYHYFQTKYPNYKLITEEKIKELCQKYNLVYGEVTDYRGFVPEKNLQEIEAFFGVIKDEDLCYKMQRSSTYVQYHAYPSQKFETWSKQVDTSKPCPLQIAAPMHDFDMRGKKIENYQIQDAPIPPTLDPVVFQSVYYEGQKYELIVTAWGMEASDPIVVNPKFN